MKKLEYDIVDHYIDKTIAGVYVDESNRLQELVEKSKKLRSLPYEEKVSKIKSMVFNNLKHPMEINPPTDFPNLIERLKDNDMLYEHPLSRVLDEGVGCCRYQSVLFFILGYESMLADHHLLQCAPVYAIDDNATAAISYNELKSGDHYTTVSFFIESPSVSTIFQDYFKEDEDTILGWLPEINSKRGILYDYDDLFSYHKRNDEMVIIKNLLKTISVYNE